MKGYRHNAKDLSGQQFGYLTAIKPVRKPGYKHLFWRCQCVCGNFKISAASDLKRSPHGSCGCKTREVQSRARRTHGMSKHPAFAVWRSMKSRCHRSTHQAWKNYGGRGITVCKRWRDSFENFWTDMGPTYRPGLTLDRRDNNGNYTPANCHWTTPTEQAANTRNNRILETPWGRMPLAQAARKSGINATTIAYRLQNGWDVETALTKKPDFRNRYTT